MSLLFIIANHYHRRDAIFLARREWWPHGQSGAMNFAYASEISRNLESAKIHWKFENRWNPERWCSRSSRPLSVRPVIVAKLHHGTAGSRYPSSSSLHSLLDSPTARSGLCLEFSSCVQIQVMCRVTFALVAYTCILQRVSVYYYMLDKRNWPDPAILSSWGWSTATAAKYTLEGSRVLPPQYTCIVSLVRTCQSLKAWDSASCSRHIRRGVWLWKPLPGRFGANFSSYTGIQANGVQDVAWVLMPSW